MLVMVKIRARAFVAQRLEHWSRKPGVESSILSEGNHRALLRPSARGAMAQWHVPFPFPFLSFHSISFHFISFNSLPPHRYG